MNPELLTAIRTLIAAVGGYVAAKDWLPDEIVSALAGLIIIAIPLVWGWYSKQPSSSEAKKVAKRVKAKVALDKGIDPTTDRRQNP